MPAFAAHAAAAAQGFAPEPLMWVPWGGQPPGWGPPGAWRAAGQPHPGRHRAEPRTAVGAGPATAGGTGTELRQPAAGVKPAAEAAAAEALRRPPGVAEGLGAAAHGEAGPRREADVRLASRAPQGQGMASSAQPRACGVAGAAQDVQRPTPLHAAVQAGFGPWQRPPVSAPHGAAIPQRPPAAPGTWPQSETERAQAPAAGLRAAPSVGATAPPGGACGLEGPAAQGPAPLELTAHFKRDRVRQTGSAGAACSPAT
jgi:hypothetical protein